MRTLEQQKSQRNKMKWNNNNEGGKQVSAAPAYLLRFPGVCARLRFEIWLGVQAEKAHRREAQFCTVCTDYICIYIFRQWSWLLRDKLLRLSSQGICLAKRVYILCGLSFKHTYSLPLPLSLFSTSPSLTHSLTLPAAWDSGEWKWFPFPVH